MTRKEAIQILKTERYCQEDTADVKRIRKAYDMAIEALSAEAPKPTGELIARADAIEAICMNDCGGCRPNECGAYLDKSCDVVKALSALPSAEGGDAEMNEVKSPYMQHSPDGADLISRTDAIEAVRKELVCDGRHEAHDKTCRFIADVLLSALPSAETTGALDDAIAKYVADGLMELPSAEAEQVTSKLDSAEAVQGEWDCMIADGSDGSHWYEYECSHCGEVVLRPYNFCPNCGARMTPYKGGEDDNA